MQRFLGSRRSAQCLRARSFHSWCTGEWPQYGSIPMEAVASDMAQSLQGMKDYSPPPMNPTQPLEFATDLEQRLEPALKVWRVISHLTSVTSDDVARGIQMKYAEDVTAAETAIASNEALYERCKTIQTDPLVWQGLKRNEQRVVESYLRNAEFNGVNLSGSQRDTFLDLKREGSQMGLQFSNNLLDVVKKGWQLVLTTEEDIAGVPEHLKDTMWKAAKAAGVDGVSDSPDQGPWLLCLDNSIVNVFLQFSERRDLREKVYRKYISRASEHPYDNMKIAKNILRVRQDMSTLLGYKSYAHASTARKMAGDPDAVYSLLSSLYKHCHPAALKEFQELTKFAQEEEGHEGPLKHWDVSYYAMKMKQKRFDLVEEEVKQFFPIDKVLNGLFQLITNLFGVGIRPHPNPVPTWHPDVQVFDVVEGDRRIASFYLDPYARPGNKRSGAWMSSLCDRSAALAPPNQEVQVPIAHVICNGSQPTSKQPSLMSFQDVLTLFHEFGHALQHMLTKETLMEVAGINGIEWDAVELPSQFMENWCYHPQTLSTISGHWETNEPLPKDMLNKILNARHHLSGTAMLRQLYFGRLDMDLHVQTAPGMVVPGVRKHDDCGFDPMSVQHQVASTHAILQPLPEDRFLASFLHLFADTASPYAAGYFSYKWAEVMSADAFARFEEEGLEDNATVQRVGRQFKDTVLSLGGGVPPAEVFQQFRGRAPDVTALLKHSGLAGKQE